MPFDQNPKIFHLLWALVKGLQTFSILQRLNENQQEFEDYSFVDFHQGILFVGLCPRSFGGVSFVVLFYMPKRLIFFGDWDLVGDWEGWKLGV